MEPTRNPHIRLEARRRLVPLGHRAVRAQHQQDVVEEVIGKRLRRQRQVSKALRLRVIDKALAGVAAEIGRNVAPFHLARDNGRRVVRLPLLPRHDRLGQHLYRGPGNRHQPVRAGIHGKLAHVHDRPTADAALRVLQFLHRPVGWVVADQNGRHPLGDYHHTGRGRHQAHHLVIRRHLVRQRPGIRRIGHRPGNRPPLKAGHHTVGRIDQAFQADRRHRPARGRQGFAQLRVGLGIGERHVLRFPGQRIRRVFLGRHQAECADLIRAVDPHLADGEILDVVRLPLAGIGRYGQRHVIARHHRFRIGRQAGFRLIAKLVDEGHAVGPVADRIRRRRIGPGTTGCGRQGVVGILTVRLGA